MSRSTILTLAFAAAAAAVVSEPAMGSASAMDNPSATGTVFHDANRNEIRDEDEQGIPGVQVSNGADVVLTDADGRYVLPVDDQTTIFITKPSGWMVPVDEQMLPQFYYNHYPNGSPYELRYGGVEPTGPLPESVDFALHRQDESAAFTSLTFADPQTFTKRQIQYMATDVIAELEGSDALFGLTVGDIVNNPLDLFSAHNDAVARVGVPWWNLPGNHDMDFDAPSDENATDTYIQTYGPTNYSFEYGDVHLIALDNVEKIGPGRGYRGLLTADQLAWIERDLQHVPHDKLVVIATHIPLVNEAVPNRAGGNTAGREQLFDLLESREHVYSFAGHRTQNSWQTYIGADLGWDGEEPLHHQVLAEVRGGGWNSGPRDERGIPQADMPDGTPNGYYTVTWDGTDYAPQYKAASLPADFLMRIGYQDVNRTYVTGGVSGSGEFSEPVAWHRRQLVDDGDHEVSATVKVNIFDGGERNVVEVKIDDGPFTPMTHLAPELDDYIVHLRQLYEGTVEAPAMPVPSSHLWSAPVPGNLSPGTHQVTVRSTSAWGQVSERTSEFTVSADRP